MKKNILILGSNGFIGRNLVKSFSKYGEKFVLYTPTIDLTNIKQVDEFFIVKEGMKFSHVIYCAIKGGRRTKEDSKDIVYDNVLMLKNLLKYKHLFGKFINLNSGASSLNTPYGISKYSIYNILKQQIDHENLYNIKIYNIFAEDESEDRMIKANIINYINKKPLTIFKDKLMDFVYFDDFFRLIYHLIEIGAPKGYIFTNSYEIDCSYQKKYYLSDVANIINRLSEHKSDIKFESAGYDPAYIGNGLHLKSIIENPIGLEQGIKNIYNHTLNEPKKS